MAVAPYELSRVAWSAADDKKAEDMVLLDLTDLSDVCDYFLIFTASNARQLDAVVDAIEEKVRINCNLKPLGREGRAGASWVLLDYGPLVVHAFLPEAREFYRLERLWGDAPRVELASEPSVSLKS